MITSALGSSLKVANPWFRHVAATGVHILHFGNGVLTKKVLLVTLISAYTDSSLM